MSLGSNTTRLDEATRNSCGATFRDFLCPLVLQFQVLIAAHNVRPEMAAMLAAVAFRGGGGFAEIAPESLQPRFSELRNTGLMGPVTARRRSTSGEGTALLRRTGNGSAIR